MTPMTTPKVFISYSWTSDDHERWVLELGSSLVESGVDVVLDKWELREGQDKYAFMERMVSDPAINKVLLICDRIYAEKADARRGGVGTESQIISAEVYQRVDQNKFVPVVTEVSEDGKPLLPAYLRSRIYIDMSNPANRYENFEQLVRWIFDKPMHQKPQLGRPPSYITEPTAPQLGTTTRFRLATEAVRMGKPSALALVEDYLTTFAANLETLRVQRSGETEYDDAVVASIEMFKMYRDEVTDLLILIGRYRSDREMYDTIHRWLESLLLYKFPPEGTTSWQDDAFDNFRFILNEVFVYTTAALLKARRYQQLNDLLATKYFVPGGPGRRDEGRLQPFDTFREYVRTLNEVRNKRLKLNRLSVVADMLKQRATRSDVTFDDLMQAEFVLVVYSVLNYPDDIWFPNTLLYASHGHAAFELFARARSKRSFGVLRELFGVESKDDLIERFTKNGNDVPWRRLWEWDGFDPLELMNARQLESEP